VAVAVVALAAAVALASPHRSPSMADDRLDESLSLALSLEDQGRFAEAADVYRELAVQQPDEAIRLRLAFCLLRSDQPAAAAQAAAGVVEAEPTNAQAVLLLGLAQRAQGLPEATATLQRFLTLDPDNQAAPQIRRMLEPAS
jgi:tetratricopeptide (TPR) repeat protein